MRRERLGEKKWAEEMREAARKEVIFFSEFHFLARIKNEKNDYMFTRLLGIVRHLKIGKICIKYTQK